ncbi:MAG: hypothetical protein JEZ09_19725 [Salinivirgaceae bacterium]|nr:hypothetical protein [Salinivirgaceae bacterium]
MTKYFIIALAIASFSLIGIESQAQIEKGDVLFEGYYGYSLAKGFWSSMEREDALDINYSGFGPVGARFEYRAAEKLSLGLDVNYRVFEFSQDYEDMDNVVYSSKYTSEQLRVMARMNFHFINEEHLDYYMGWGVGYKYSVKDFSSNDDSNIEVEWPNIFPVAFRVSTGVRYFFTENLGLHGEVGIGGGSFFNGGITYKL